MKVVIFTFAQPLFYHASTNCLRWRGLFCQMQTPHIERTHATYSLFNEKEY